jgi:CRISPR/Cas system-associated exonuclease Cas4 (RecB family)
VKQARQGVHLTDAIYCLRKAYWNKIGFLPPSPNEILHFILGLGLQDALLGGDNPSVAQKDGMIISPDYWDGEVLGELKTTRIGQKRLDAHEFPDGWMKQLMGYAYVLGVDKAFLLVLTIVKPEVYSFILKFTQEELEANWKELTDRAEQLQVALDIGTLPPASIHDWECKDCRYKLRCDVANMGGT